MTPGTYRWDGWEDDRHDAVFDSEREFRYSLTRTWNPEKPTLAWIMLNPSTADETEDDPTIRRCLGYAKDWGYGEIVVANLFALRATDPSELREHENPVGEDNDEHLRRVCEDADRVVAAWGANGDLQNRGRGVAKTLDADLYALDTTKDGHPVHPLYQPADAEPEPWDERALLAATDGGRPSTGSERGGRRLSAFPYPGGKTPYVEQILQHFPHHRRYVEPFGGSAAVLLNKPESYVEVFNDLDDDVVQFFRVAREQPEELREWLRKVPYSETVYEDWQAAYNEGERSEGPVERAGRWFFLRYANYGGSPERRAGFKRPGKRNEARSFRGGIEEIGAVVDRLQEVTIAKEDYAEILDRYDDQETLFYADPPYLEAENLYYPAAEGFDHGAFVDTLRDREGHWIVSYDVLPTSLEEIATTIAEFEVRYSLPNTDSCDRKQSTEKLAMNFDPAETPKFVTDRTEQQTLSVATDGGDENCSLSTASDRSGPD